MSRNVKKHDWKEKIYTFIIVIILVKQNLESQL